MLDVIGRATTPEDLAWPRPNVPRVERALDRLSDADARAAFPGGGARRWEACRRLRSRDRAMVQHQQGISAQGNLRVRPPLIIAELHLEHALVEPLDDRAHLTPNKPMLGHVHEQGDDIENVDVAGADTGRTSEEIAAGQSGKVFAGPHNPAGPDDAEPGREHTRLVPPARVRLVEAIVGSLASSTTA